MICVLILIVVFNLAKILFPIDEKFFMVLLESEIKLKTGDQAPDFELDRKSVV